MHAYSIGVNIQWEATAYTYSENSGTVELLLFKEGSTLSSVSVEVITVAGSATGEIDQAFKACFKICNNLFY